MRVEKRILGGHEGLELVHVVDFIQPLTNLFCRASGRVKTATLTCSKVALDGPMRRADRG